MADITRLQRLVDGIMRGIDVSQNTLVVGSIKVGVTSPTELTKAILDNLVALQGGGDFTDATNAHTHDGRYHTKAILASTAPGEEDESGASLIGIEDSGVYYTGTNVEAALQEAGSAIGELEDNVADLVTLSGVAENSTNLGTFTGDVIADNSTVKGALQDLEVEVELKADKTYVDSIAQGLEPKGSVVTATTANITLSGAQTVDGVTLVNGNRVLVKDQTVPSENGLYDYNDAGAWLRSADFDGLPDHEVKGGDWVYVEEGAANAGTSWAVLGQGAKDVDTDPINWTKINKVTPFQAGNAIDITSDSISVKVDDASIEIASDALRIKDAGVLSAKIASDAVDGSKIRLDNAEYLRARNNADDADVNVLRVNSSDVVEFASLPQAAGSASDNNDLVNKGYLDNRISGIDTSLIVEEFSVGESLSGVSGLRAFRMMRAADAGFSAGRVIRADNNASTADNFHVIGLAVANSEDVEDPLMLVKSGRMVVTGHGLTVGEPFWLGANGQLTSTAPTNSGIAAAKCGMARDADTLEIQIQGANIN